MSFDTVSPPLSICYSVDNKVVDEIISDKSNFQLDKVIAFTELLIGRNDKSYKDIDLFSVIVGPGSFTGIKIAIASIKSIELFAGSSITGFDRFEIYMNIIRLEGILKKVNYIVLRANSFRLFVCKFDDNFNIVSESSLLIEEFLQECEIGAVISGDFNDELKKIDNFHKDVIFVYKKYSESYYCSSLCFKGFIENNLKKPTPKFMDSIDSKYKKFNI